MQGLYLWTKLELLISFYMLQPLWGALAWALGKVGGTDTHGRVHSAVLQWLWGRVQAVECGFKAGGCWVFQPGALAWALGRWVLTVVGCMASCCSHWWVRWPGRWEGG